MLTVERLKERLRYDPETGIFTRVTSCRGQGKNAYAGSPQLNGYIAIGIDRKKYLAHRLAWLYMTGEWPAEHIDHINGQPSDNKFANLRRATNAENGQNQNRAKGRTNLLGVTEHGSGFKAKIHVNGKAIHLGTFPSKEMAGSVYIKAKRYFHPFGTI